MASVEGRTGKGRPVVLAMVHLPPPAHGASLQNQRMLEGGLAREFDFRVVPLRFASGFHDLGRFSVRKVARSMGYLVVQLVRITLDRPDAGYMMLTTSGPGMMRDAIYMAAFRMTRTPYAVRIPTMGLPEGVDGHRFAGGLVLRGLKGASAVITLHPAHRAEVARLVPAARVEVVENALPDLPAAPAPRAATAGVTTLLFLSNLREEKGLFTLLDALADVFPRMPEVRAVIAGPWQDGSTERRFHTTVRGHGLTGRVEHAGPVYGEAKLRLLATADVFVFPSHRDNAPNVVLEAMRHGLPVVATDVGGTPGMVEEGVTGRLVPPGDASALASALTDLLRDPARAIAMGRAGRARFEERFSVERWETEMGEVLRRAAAPARPVPSTPSAA